MLGAGSNVVLPAALKKPVLIVAMKGISLLQDNADAWVVDAAAGESWHEFVQYCVDQEWNGLENLALIPGTVGAAPVQNIGAYGVEIASRIESVTAWHVKESRSVTLTAEQCQFAYRDSLFKRAAPGTWIITSVRFRLPKPWLPVTDYPDLSGHSILTSTERGSLTSRNIFDVVCDVRRSKLPDPKVLGNAGSFFKNPIVSAEYHQQLVERFPKIVSYPQSDGRFKLAAGWLIDQAGWKGVRRAAVGVHDRQALVLVNYGGASSGQVLELADDISASVASIYGVRLEIEPVVFADQV